MARFLIAAAFAAASVPAAAAPAPILPDAHPAIWVVSDSDTVVYLFGTFHALDGKSEWFNDEIATAFSASDELVLETIVPDAPRVNGPMPSMSSLRVAPSASFLASTRMAVSAGRSRGMSVANGADMVLRLAAESAGKKVEGLESFEFQLGMFSQIPSASPQQAPTAGQPVDPSENMGIIMNQLQAAWNRGDQGIFTFMLDQMRTNAPDSYRIMFTQRNSNWADWISRRLQKPGTVFVAVGAGHLAGDDSVQAKLAQRGVPSARIN